MNETFFARLTSVIFLLSFISGVLFNDKFTVHWQDFIFGLAFSVSVYNLWPIVKKKFADDSVAKGRCL